MVLGDKGLEIGSNDGNFKAAIGGRLQLDGQTNWNSHNLPNATGANTTNALADGTSLRRARLHAEGTFFKDYDYKFEYDFTRGPGTTAAGVTDAYIRWNALKPFALTVGQFKEPFSLEEATSNRFLTFIERNMAVNAFSDNPNAYRIGAMGSYSEQRWMAAGALMSESVGGSGLTCNAAGTCTNVNGATLYNTSSVNTNGNANRNNGSGNSSWDVTGRVAGRPWYNSETEFLHVGASGSYRTINNNYTGNSAFNNGGTLFAASIGNVDRTALLNTGNLTKGNKGAALLRTGSLHPVRRGKRLGVRTVLHAGRIYPHRPAGQRL
ncbi:porin [Methylogaea oryzae]|uniref:porin n=1 Tax=Methylogaea oryzae TaxID=1295382 RepID=UPI0006D1EB4A|nr:porin [Methylogaea oryzae]